LYPPVTSWLRSCTYGFYSIPPPSPLLSPRSLEKRLQCLHRTHIMRGGVHMSLPLLYGFVFFLPPLAFTPLKLDDQSAGYLSSLLRCLFAFFELTLYPVCHPALVFPPLGGLKTQLTRDRCPAPLPSPPPALDPTPCFICFNFCTLLFTVVQSPIDLEDNPVTRGPIPERSPF